MGKTVKGKEKVKAKIAEAKKKIARKVKGCALLALSLLIVGCSTATPASRATSASYEINVKVCMDEGVKSATVNVPFTFGDGALASADSSGSTETQTATPTLDIKPDVNVNYAQGGGITNRGTGGAKASGAAGIIESLSAEGLATLKDWIVNKKTGTVTLQKKDGTTVTADCKDGACTFSDGTTVTAEDCANCTAK
jgi:ABC-type transport system substrate-binding protein